MAFCVSVAAVLVLRPVCFYFGHVDHPGGRKRHDLATPLSGGLAISLSILALGWGIVPNRHFSGFAVGLIVLLLLGGMDDRKHVPASLRLALQTIAVTVGMYWPVTSVSRILAPSRAGTTCGWAIFRCCLRSSLRSASSTPST